MWKIYSKMLKNYCNKDFHCIFFMEKECDKISAWELSHCFVQNTDKKATKSKKLKFIIWTNKMKKERQWGIEKSNPTFLSMIIYLPLPLVSGYLIQSLFLLFLVSFYAFHAILLFLSSLNPSHDHRAVFDWHSNATFFSLGFTFHT